MITIATIYLYNYLLLTVYYLLFVFVLTLVGTVMSVEV